MRSYRATHNQIAVSANQAETGINAFQNADTTMLWDQASIPALEHRREDNANEANGKEEADTIYHLGTTLNGSLNSDMAQVQHVAFLLAYGLGDCASVANGNGYTHTITPIDGEYALDQSLPGFSMVQRLGKTVAMRRFASCFVDQFTLSLATDEWAKASATIKGTGKYESGMVEEVVSANGDAVSLSLAANGVAGATAAERLDNIHGVDVELAPNVWTPVTVTDVDGANPATLTITNPGGSATPVNYRVLYAPTPQPWQTLPAAVEESALRVAQMTLIVGGHWDGSRVQGGRAITGDFRSLEYSVANSLELRFVPGQGLAADAYAGTCFRPKRRQTLRLNRELRDMLLQQRAEASDAICVHVALQGSEFAPGERYKAELVWPECKFLNSPINLDGEVLAEAGDLVVMAGDTYPSTIAKITNQAASYAASA